MIKDSLKNRIGFSFDFLLPFLGSVAAHGGILLVFIYAGSSDLASLPLGSTLNSETITVAVFEETRLKVAPVKSRRQGDVPAFRQDHSNKKAPSTADSSVGESSQTVGAANGTAQASALEKYSFGLRQLIESKRIYPPLSRRMNEIGKVIVSFQVLRSGQIQNVKIKSPSSYPRLDQAALATVTNVGRYQPIPDQINGSEISVDVPIEFSL